MVDGWTAISRRLSAVGLKKKEESAGTLWRFFFGAVSKDARGVFQFVA
jgi:hypothetical protein